jgi:4-hydroxy-3-methylbut-2-enyl diphosphate reductase
VNQDALSRALSEPIDAAFVIGGKNSSNTYQLYRLCEETLGERAYFIQSEANIQSLGEVEHYVFPSISAGRLHGHMEKRPLWPTGHPSPVRVMITGGASCPDGIIQQVITRINSLFPAGSLRSIEEVLASLADSAPAPTGQNR